MSEALEYAAKLVGDDLAGVIKIMNAPRIPKAHPLSDLMAQFPGERLDALATSLEKEFSATTLERESSAAYAACFIRSFLAETSGYQAPARPRVVAWWAKAVGGFYPTKESLPANIKVTEVVELIEAPWSVPYVVPKSDSGQSS